VHWELPLRPEGRPSVVERRQLGGLLDETGYGAAAGLPTNVRASTILHVLSLGFTVDLWRPISEATDDTRTRLDEYSRYLASYDVVALGRRRISPSRLELGRNFTAHAACGRSWVGAFASALRIANGILRRKKIDLIQAQDPVLTGVAASILGSRYRIPVNVCVYGANPWDAGWLSERPRRLLQARIARSVLHRAAGIQVDGKTTEASLLQHGIAADRIARKPMIPSIIDRLFELRSDSALRGVLTENGRWPTVALFVGRLARQKNLSFLLDVLSDLKKRGLAVRLVIVGSGSIESELRSRARDLDVGDRVLWLGEQPHANIGPLMAGSDVIVLPSIYEGFARVLVEAAAAGRPIVCSSVSGADEAVVHGTTGFVCPIGDRSAFVAAITRLVQCPDLANEMGRRARIFIRGEIEPLRDLSLQVRIWERIVQRTDRAGDLGA